MALRKERPQLTHLNAAGEAHMVDVGGKAVTRRRAVARGEVALGPAAWRALMEGSLPKGDAFAAARLAGIQAAKKTADLIPLCHPLPITKVGVELTPIRSRRVVRITAEVHCDGKTGVEMEAADRRLRRRLTLYDMLKAVDKSLRIGPIELVEKSGGKSGTWKRNGGPPRSG
jgi:cyclic pyranopterin monophosphate synthase